MLANLHVDTLEKLRDLFERRINSDPGHNTPIRSWRQVVARLVPKKRDVRYLKDWRPISLTAALQRWYCSVLSMLVEAAGDPVPHNCVGFSEGRQPMEITEFLRLAAAKAKAWGFGFSSMQADISKAFDHLGHEHLVTAMSTANIPYFSKQ
jgi:hypothetical protein